jgi:uncharacterized protein YkwD
MKKILVLILICFSHNSFSQKKQNMSVNDTMFRESVDLEFFEKTFFDELNKYRKLLNLSELIWDPTLAKNSRNHSIWMEKTNIFEHSKYPGSECILQSGYGVGSTYLINSKKLLQIWINSPPHNRIITSKYATKVGIGVNLIEDSYNGVYATLLLN